MSSNNEETTTEDSRKRKADEAKDKESVQNINGEDKPRAKKKPTPKEAKANHTRGIAKGEDKEAHAGSYAQEAQRKLFNVELPPEEDPELSKTRVKRKVAFLLSYLGTNYTGFQINGGQKTLQGEFELALLRCYLLMRSNFGYPYKYGW